MCNSDSAAIVLGYEREMRTELQKQEQGQSKPARTTLLYLCQRLHFFSFMTFCIPLGKSGRSSLCFICVRDSTFFSSMTFTFLSCTTPGYSVLEGSQWLSLMLNITLYVHWALAVMSVIQGGQHYEAPAHGQDNPPFHTCLPLKLDRIKPILPHPMPHTL